MAASVEELKRWAQEHLSWFGQSAFRITTPGSRIFIDPFRVPSSAGPATLILVTHPHPDHYDKRAIAGLRGLGTMVVLPMSCAEPGQRAIAPGQTETIGGVKITGVPSYNVAKRFHPKSGSWLGYIVEVDGVRIYHAGDTDPLPEMSGLRPDIALLPVGGMLTMNWKAAAAVSRTLGATLAIPMHFNMLIGGRRAGKRFSAAVGTGSLVLSRG
ncbi:MAG: MBL fold metallo-hydrolase [Spirochaetia bacterium]|jgi:L-ascorbate metabolism protein UlaG (beta-lactamase superfamily)